LGKKAQKDILKSQKESEMKDSIIREERARLHNEAVRSHNVYKLLNKNFKNKFKQN